jgi:hypothetical protein
MLDVDTLPNVYYVSKPVKTDISVDSKFKDTFIGLADNVDLKSGPNTVYYMAQTNVVNTDDAHFGSIDGIKQMYLKFNVNSVSQTNAQNSPYFDIYKLDNTTTITEGNLTPLTNATALKPIIYTSNYDLMTPWRIEDFDGSGKYFIKGPESRIAPAFNVYDSVLKITINDYYEAANAETGKVHIGMHTSRKKANVFLKAVNQVLGTNLPNTDSTITLFKGEDGLYGAEPKNSPQGIIEEIGTGYASRLFGGFYECRLTRDQWVKHGAVATQQLAESNVGFNQFEDNYVSKASPDNTMFTTLTESPDIRDIKDQTLEGPGGDERFTAFTFANLENGQTNSEGSTLHMKNFWENHSTSTYTGTSAQTVANCFGRAPSGTALNQKNVATISGIPKPKAIDDTTPGRLKRSFAPEIEILMKIKKMDQTTNTSSSPTGTLVSSVGYDRSFTIALTRNAPSENEELGSFMFRNTQDVFLTFVNEDATTGTIDVYGLSNFSGTDIYKLSANYGDKVGIQASALSSVKSSNHYTTIPMDTWVTLRLRLDMTTATDACLAYFTSADTTGALNELVCETTGGLSDNTSWCSNLTFWVNNMRAINSAPSSDTTTHINNTFAAADDITEDDKEVSVMIDRVAFYGWNNNTLNSTVTEENYPVGPIGISPGIARPLEDGNDTINKTGQDAYYATERAPTQTIISFGYNSSNVTSFRNIGVSGSNIFLNNFITGDERNVQPIPITSVSGGFWTDATDSYNTNGGEGSTLFKPRAAGGSITVGTTDAENSIRIGGFNNAIDQFTQKGSFRIRSDFKDAGGEHMIRTGNYLHAAIVTRIEDDGKTVYVDKPEMFDIPLTQKLALEHSGGLKYAVLNAGTGSCGYTTDLTQSKPREGNKIFLNRSILKDDAGSTLFNNLYNPYSIGTYDSFAYMLLSPKCFWINIALCNVNSSAFGDWFNTGTGSSAEVLADRVYSTALPVSDSGSTVGTTWNEYLFNDGVYANRHSIDFISDEDSIVDLSTNYGFGVPDDTENNILDSGYIRRDYFKAGVNYFDLNNYIDIANPKLGDKFNFIVKPSFPHSADITQYTVNINTKDAATNPSSVVYGVVDNLPEVDNFRVSPVTDFLKQDIDINNMTKETSTDLEFRWSEQSRDAWYRVLWVDDRLIKNKYHRANFWLPLSGNTTSVGFYTSDTDTSQTALSGVNTPDLFGFSGYGTKLNNLVLTKTGNSVTVGATDQFTFMAHLKPTVGSTDQDAFTASGSSTEALRLRINSSNQVQVFIKNKSKTLTSTTAYDCDGKQPLAVIVTYKKSDANNNLKLYVNGKLEDTADYTVNFEHDNNSIYVGGDGASTNKYTGFIEEITFHTKAAYIATNNNVLRLSTNSLDDLDGTNKSINYQSRLFIMDYHNIRGKSKNLVCRSNTASWKVTGLT